MTFVLYPEKNYSDLFVKGGGQIVLFCQQVYYVIGPSAEVVVCHLFIVLANYNVTDPTEEVAICFLFYMCHLFFVLTNYNAIDPMEEVATCRYPSSFGLA